MVTTGIMWTLVKTGRLVSSEHISKYVDPISFCAKSCMETHLTYTDIYERRQL